MFRVKKGEKFGGEGGRQSLGVRRQPGGSPEESTGLGVLVEASAKEREERKGKEEETLEKNNERLRVRE